MATTASMKTNDPTSYVIVVAVFLCLELSTVNAADIEVGIRVGASLTDNVFLESSPDEEDDLVYRAAPWISVDHESPNLDAKLRYRFDWYKYAELGSTSSYHMGEASITGKLWEESLAVELGATKMQVLRQPDAGITPDRLPLTGNLVDRDEIYVHPRFEQSIGSSVTVHADYRYSDGSYNDPDIQDDINHDASASIQNYNAGQGLTWALRYNLRKTEYELSNDWEYRQASAELGFWVNPKLRLFGVSGLESPWDDPFNPDLEDPYWEAGFAYQSGNNISAEFAAGERSFGSSWRGMLELEFQRGNTSLSYNESPSTTAFGNRGGRQSVLDPDDIDEFLNTPGQAERYLSQVLQWDMTLDFRRSGVKIVLFDEDRSGRLQSDGSPLDDQSQKGVRASFNWQAGTRTDVTISGDLVRTKRGSDDRAEYRNVRLTFGYDLGSRTAVSLDYSYRDQRPRGVTSTSRDYVNNVVSIFFTITTK